MGNGEVLLFLDVNGFYYIRCDVSCRQEEGVKGVHSPFFSPFHLPVTALS